MTAAAVNKKKIAWLGDFPSHWQVLRIKNLFQEVDNRSETGSEELLSVSHYTGVTLKRESLESDDEHLTNAESLVGYKMVETGDLVVNIMLAWNGSMGISPHNGITSPAYCVYRVKGDNNPEYFGYLFTTALFKAEFRRHSTGIIDSRLRLYSDKFFSIFALVPPKTEQDEIVQYIKAQEEKVNRFIEKKQRFIELLKEQKFSMIYKIITNGLNDKVSFKNSEIPFAEKFPIHYKIEKFNKYVFLRHGFQFRDYDFTDEGVKIVKITQLNPNGYLDLTKANTIDESRIDEFRDIIINEGDILMALTGGTIGKIIRADIKDEILLQNYRVGNFIPLEPEELDKDYLYLQLSSPFIQKQINYHVRETGQPNIGKGDFRKIFLTIPPIDEQKIIVSHIRTETASIDTAIAKAEREIELIREHKEAMIAEAVMGKRKTV
ncbi:MAG: restriction endonuclease subunit S [Bacteroidia bacterium]|nr:restriction endonuclease subunit S [Bacteroidia bacterium]